MSISAKLEQEKVKTRRVSSVRDPDKGDIETWSHSKDVHYAIHKRLWPLQTLSAPPCFLEVGNAVPEVPALKRVTHYRVILTPPVIILLSGKHIWSLFFKNTLTSLRTFVSVCSFSHRYDYAALMFVWPLALRSEPVLNLNEVTTPRGPVSHFRLQLNELTESSKSVMFTVSRLCLPVCSSPFGF